MVRTEMNVISKTFYFVVYICMILLVTTVSVSWSIEQEQEQEQVQAPKAICKFSKYLENSANRARYKKTVARARSGYATENNFENAAMYGVIVNANIGNNNGENLDSFSAGCLSCHDGTSASNVRPNLINNPDRKHKMMRISGKHPIGMDYEKYAATNRNLKSLDEMSISVTLAEGRVSCITCHDPLNSEQNHLVITRSGADLCSACHTM